MGPKLNRILLLLFLLLLTPIMPQDFFDEMELTDISNDADIKSTIIRASDQALLIIKSHISSLRFKSNNEIFESKKAGEGIWHIKLRPGTHRISFQAEAFFLCRKGYTLIPKM